MTNPRIQNMPRNKVIEFIAELFNVATIALVGVAGILAVAASI
ncbi:MAG TPA: hypothetical protein VHZ32_01735 [Rhizomicrobium sp.]|jgi:hypothetical protein|nr:hypothetical protein [Rhizomicrobium sp.]